MKKGFTLLELIVVIIILGILATLAATQYTRMIEKSRGAEARIILGSIRTNEAAYRLQMAYCTNTGTDVGIGSDYPSACTTTHYFSYGLTANTADGFTALATRCTAGGKTSNASTAATIQLVTNFSNGQDSFTYAAPY